MNDPPRESNTDQRRSAALVGLIIVLALAIAGVVLFRARKNAQLEDCLMSGRTNCAPIEVPVRR